MRIRYIDGSGALRQILHMCTERGLTVQGFVTRHSGAEHGGLLGRLADGLDRDALPASEVEVELDIDGHGSLPELVRELSQLRDIVSVQLEDPME